MRKTFLTFAAILFILNQVNVYALAPWHGDRHFEELHNEVLLLLKSGVKLKILFVDDEFADERWAGDSCKKLKGMGFIPGAEIEFAESGSEGIEKARRFRPDIVITDLNMERANSGFRLASEIAKEFPHISIVIASTDRPMQREMERYKREGIITGWSLSKPSDENETLKLLMLAGTGLVSKGNIPAAEALRIESSITLEPEESL
ncbi:response regulator [Candidatus Auribacterota bacterium]